MSTLRALLVRFLGMPRSETQWRRFNRMFAATLAATGSCVLFLVYLVDPWGVVPFSLPIERPIVDIMQRHLYPMVIRSERYDSLVLGNSTVRLVDPAWLEHALGGRFAALALNDGRAFEQWRLADLYLREVGTPKTIVIGLDGVWCHPRADAPENRITMRGFPEWVYDDDPWNNLLHVLNSRTVEFAVRLIATKAGLRDKRLEDNGYGVFVPPESEYDLARARRHIWGEAGPREIAPVRPPVGLSPQEVEPLSYPALDWLADLMRRTAGATGFVLVWTPVHVVSQPQPGSRQAAEEEACKAAFDRLAGANGAIVVDWRIPSEVTTDDTNYWDGLHYRLPIARAIVDSIAAARSGDRPGKDAPWRLRVPSIDPLARD